MRLRMCRQTHTYTFQIAMNDAKAVHVLQSGGHVYQLCRKSATITQQEVKTDPRLSINFCVLIDV
jgi:hypothetical protein